tara:strand:+ start:216 stop:425 length:210 start_codon:yes stop_codon:yes gene_type:complete
MVYEYEVSFCQTSWYQPKKVTLSNKEYAEAEKNGDLEDLIHELYWDQEPIETDCTKPQYFVEDDPEQPE